MFSPDALLREARRQKGLAPLDVPAVCILDPDGDILRQPPKIRPGHALRCLALLPHRSLYVSLAGADGRHRRLRRRRAVCRVDRRGIIRLRLPLSAQSDLGRSNQRRRAAAVFRGDRPRAARRGHQLSLRRARRICRSRSAARRDRGQRSEAARACASWSGRAGPPMRRFGKPPKPSRPRAPRACWRSKWRRPRSTRSRGHAANPVLCLAHVTNTMGQAERDFEKGESDGTVDALKVLETIVNGISDGINRRIIASGDLTPRARK